MTDFDRETAASIVAEEFDAAYYVLQLRDEPEVDHPLEHFLSVGWKRGLDPNPRFSTSAYLADYPDVEQAGVNPFVHYVGWGRKEHRFARSSSLSLAGGHGEDPTASSADSDPAGRVIEKKAVESDPYFHLRRQIGISEQEFHRVVEAFDPVYYLNQSPDLMGAPISPLEHYLLHGWREHRDPSAAFSTSYYLRSNADIRSAGVNPLVHYILYGVLEGRNALPFGARMALNRHPMSVSVIVPNFNHARFLKTRVESILKQNYALHEVIFLDDCSKDNSVKILRSYAEMYPDLIKLVVNEVNSGSVFRQWQKGLELATGDLVWICESDDYCELNFLEEAVKPFADPSVMISFGRIQFCNENGEAYEGLDEYRERSAEGLWAKSFARPACWWFSGPFALANVIPNVGGCVFRRQAIPDEIFDEVAGYRVSGDWFLYCHLAQGGQIAFQRDAIAYFRQHGRNTSVSSFKGAHYYTEHQNIMVKIRKMWGTDDDVATGLYARLYRHFRYAGASEKIGSLANHYSNDFVLKTKRDRRHVLICILGFVLGGGEIFPINIANALLERGYIVSVLILRSTNGDPVVMRMLNPGIAVYDAQYVKEVGISEFLLQAGVDLIHSHNAGIEFLFFGSADTRTQVPYVVTLHGSYESTPIPDDMMIRLLRGVSQWAYLTERNLSHFAGLPLSYENVTRIDNGVPDDDREYIGGREALGISEDAVVFVVASRAIREKGWHIAADALKRVRSESQRDLHLVLCGNGPELDKLRRAYADCSAIHFVGFQDRVCGLYRLCDVVMLPSRFGGESVPLSVLQGLRVGRPIIATAIGDIPRLIVAGSENAGSLISYSESDEIFTASLATAMTEMIDPEIRRRYALSSSKLGEAFGMDHVVTRYEEIFKAVMGSD